ncbi:acyl-CoA dehydrogenase [Acrocarpospora phusangensis]|uniref:Acyl-CoA dehydrogenase n=1 Tax=Acrocarpospora phusangensis TaxID=1070424 RepID=A0A919QH39_9ACTN|nr:acyl-CoA dehydrogenase family protein [Acrocarpospora phusangensis]GIH27834.1 acyl-CoA dehydrogenase [Acrocarpospora phusangensis]
MDFGSTGREAELLEATHAALRDPAVQAAYEALRQGRGEPDARALYRELGRHRLLAPGWPAVYGGRDAGHTESATVISVLVRAGMPDTLHVLSVQIVGQFLLTAGTEEQRLRHLPALAAGERFATVLYTEPEAGSDLASLVGSADPDGDGYRLTGVKVFGLKSGQSDLALCAMRTGRGASKYEGISLFLVDLDAPGVSRATLPTLGDEQFDRVEFDGVKVGSDALVGSEGQGWELLNRCLAIERTGLDYSLKAQRWYAATLAGLTASSADDALLAEIGRHGARVAAGTLLTYHMLSRLDAGVVDEAAAAMAKHHTSETAQAVAVWSSQVHGPGYGGRDLGDPEAALLESAYREAPGLRLSAGTSEIMLQIVSGATAALGHSGEDLAWT